MIIHGSHRINHLKSHFDGHISHLSVTHSFFSCVSLYLTIVACE